MLEKRAGKNIKALNNADILSLCKVYQSLKDGMAGIDDYFDVAAKVKSSVGLNVADLKTPKDQPDMFPEVENA